ncbi:selenocysteine insertion sequence-binding protein 2 isoform X4 [Alligator mississippiensis]|uniref:Selenocysteine insertion sequence-binding protein 2 isoform B n=1 Tax=Alligator mississippiensis TaxID=8496 RepID=A0A151M810_ALLMI|nr:selenocysteine insertion sequence-binding protein 2 isoform X4 [Alligator mississippiensis]KYO20654.1 selenocysteine insertion sequence-binding protein 2 isoform B [Alligator mississippiensis]
MSSRGQPGLGRHAQGIKLSAEVKPFVPKYATVTVAWSEPSEACVLPRYLTTCYPFVQEPSMDKQHVCTEDVSWDGSSSLSQSTSHSVMRSASLGEYSNSPYSSDVAPNVYPIASSHHDHNDSKYHSRSKIAKDYIEQTCPVRHGTRNISKRSSKDDEQKLDKKKPEGNDTFDKMANRRSLQTSAYGRNSLNQDRCNKFMNRKSKQVPKSEIVPKPAFQVTLSDFPELQSLGKNNVLDLPKHKRGPSSPVEDDVTLPRRPLTGQTSALGTTREEASVDNKAAVKTLTNKEAGSVFSSFDARTVLPQASAKSSTHSHFSWATIPAQPPKTVVSTPASDVLSRSHSDSKEKQDIRTNSKSETRNDASEAKPEEVSEKKKKREKKKKKPKPSSELQNENIIVQAPPRIEDAEEFPDLVAASDEKSRMKSQHSACISPGIIVKQYEVLLAKDYYDSHPENDSTTPKLHIAGRKQAASATLERKKMQETSKTSGKKSQIPVKLDLGGMLAVLEQKQQAEKLKQSSKSVVLSVGGAIPLLSKEANMVTKNQQLNQGKTPHNPLDSSAPLVKKGKQREVPKAKKPTPLKKIILKEREQRKQQHLLEQAAIPKDEDTVHQCVESSAEDQAQDTKAAITEDIPVTSLDVIQDSSEVLLACTELKDSSISVPTVNQLNTNLPKIHSRRFRDYCSQVLSKEVDSCVTDLLKELVRFQDRLYQKDPVKAKTKRRLVMGLREVLKHLKLKKLKCVIISPNCEKIQSKGGLDETLHTIIDCACEQNIPFVFALNRKALGHCVNKAVPVSVVGIFSYDGAQDHFHRMVQLTVEARTAYKAMIAALEEEAAEEGSEKCNSTHEESLPETSKAPHVESDDDVPNYIKIWRRKLEEEYSPYALELEKSATAEMLTLNLEEPQ